MWYAAPLALPQWSYPDNMQLGELPNTPPNCFHMSNHAYSPHAEPTKIPY